MVALACGGDPLSGEAARVRVEWPVADQWVDVVIEDASGNFLELIECREHTGHLPEESIVSFLTNVQTLRDKAAGFRYVSTARFLENGTDLGDAKKRRQILQGLGFDDDPDVLWQLGVDSRSALAAYSVVLLADRGGDADLYTRIYARMAAQMAHRYPGDGDRILVAIRDVHLELFRAIDKAGIARDMTLDTEDAFPVDELRRLLQPPPQRAAEISAENVQSVLRREIYDSKVTLGDIFIESGGTYEVPAENRTLLYSGTALAALFEWLATARERATRLGPLLVIGGFGSGKSSLLTMFASRLLDAKLSVIPILVPLRDMIPLGGHGSFTEILREYVKREWRIDFLPQTYASDVRYCLLLDGFDELNLYFSRDGNRWVEQIYLELKNLSRYRHLAIAVSSRPILLLDVSRRDFPGTHSARLAIHDFTPEQVSEWCARYRSATGTVPDLSAEFLAERNLLEVCRTPIVLYMLARIIEDDPAMLSQQRYSNADVFRIFVDWTIKKGGYRHDELKHHVPANYREILQDAAWHLSQADGGFMDERQLLQLLRAEHGAVADEIPVDRNLLVAHMFQPVDRLGENRLIEFRHQSFRDFLVAERIWRICSNASAGKPLTPEAWLALRGKPVTVATVQFFAEIAQGATSNELRSLYLGLIGVDEVHTYWSTWMVPIWKQMEDNAQGPAALQSVRSHVAALAPHACSQATLGFLLKVKIFAVLASRRKTDEIPEPSAEALVRLLALQIAFPETDVAASGRALLGQSLDGLRLGAGSSITHADLSHSSLRGAHLMSVTFRNTDLRGVWLDSARLEGCRFDRSALETFGVSDLRLERCTFARGEANFGDFPKPLRKLQLVDCRFEAITLSFCLEEARITGCNWSNVVLEPTTLVRCELDRDAQSFFRDNGAELIDCTVV